MMKVLVPLAILPLLAACAADAPSASTAPKEETVYRTGSNIPSRSTTSVTTVSKEDYERDRDRAPQPGNPNSGGARGR